MTKRILIVDDEASVVFFLGENLAELGAGCEVETACSGEEALEKISAHHFDLVITDLRMPGVDGLELVEQVRARYPQTRLILMTAFGSDQVEAEARRLQVYRYITKPFRIEDMVDAARQALGEMAISQNGVLVLSDERFETITRCLSDLRFEIGAQCILLADIMGQLITQVGLTTGLEVDTLSSLIGGGFATTFEVARRLGQDRAFNLNYQEGNRYDVYSSNVGNNLFLTIVYDKRAGSSRIGLVWLYTKRAIKKLLEITSVAEVARAEELLTDDFGASLSQELDSLFDEVPASPPVEVNIPDVEQHQDVQEELPADRPASTFSLEQAIRAGLLDERFACDE